MKLTEQHIIKHNDPRFAVIDAAAFKSKNLYNAGATSTYLLTLSEAMNKEVCW